MEIRSLAEEFTFLLRVREQASQIAGLYPGTGHEAVIFDLSQTLLIRAEERILYAADHAEDYLPTITFHADVEGNLKMLIKAHDFADTFAELAHRPNHRAEDEEISALANAYLAKIEERVLYVGNSPKLEKYLPDGPPRSKKGRTL